MQESWVQSLGEEDPLEKEMAIHSSTLAWKIPWTQEPGKLQSMGLHLGEYEVLIFGAGGHKGDSYFFPLKSTFSGH